MRLGRLWRQRRRRRAACLGDRVRRGERDPVHDAAGQGCPDRAAGRILGRVVGHGRGDRVGGAQRRDHRGRGGGWHGGPDRCLCMQAELRGAAHAEGDGDAFHVRLERHGGVVWREPGAGAVRRIAGERL